jgi:hypothetical protein
MYKIQTFNFFIVSLATRNISILKDTRKFKPNYRQAGHGSQAV